MDIRRRLHRHQERHPINRVGLTGKHAAHPSPRFTMLGERKRALQDVAGRACETLRFFFRPERLAVVFLEGGLEIEGVHRARATVHEQLDDTANPGRMMEPTERPGRIGKRCTVGSSPHFPSSPLPREKMRKRHRPEAAAGSGEEITARRKQERHGRNPSPSLVLQSTNKKSSPVNSARATASRPCRLARSRSSADSCEVGSRCQVQCTIRAILASSVSAAGSGAVAAARRARCRA